jgi:aspartate carbamoyltransferase catalytic subunit
MILHPGPVNWGVEIEEDLKEKLFFQEQIKNSVKVRVKILRLLL